MASLLYFPNIKITWNFIKGKLQYIVYVLSYIEVYYDLAALLIYGFRGFRLHVKA